jgi:hypothetical protein
MRLPIQYGSRYRTGWGIPGNVSSIASGTPAGRGIPAFDKIRLVLEAPDSLLPWKGLSLIATGPHLD